MFVVCVWAQDSTAASICQRSVSARRPPVSPARLTLSAALLLTGIALRYLSIRAEPQSSEMAVGLFVVDLERRIAPKLHVWETLTGPDGSTSAEGRR